MADAIKVTSSVQWVLKRKGKVIGKGGGQNLVVDAGLDYMALLFVTSPGAARISHCALGSSTAVVLPANTALAAEIASSRTADTTSVASGKESIFTFDVTAGATWNVKEFGLFNDGTTGTMIARFLTQIFTMVNGDTLAVTWTLRFGT